MAPAGDRAGTSDRLLVAATDLFARRGFHGTSIREIAKSAGANVAAGHYHYGSKRGLYLQVLRDQFARVRASFDAAGRVPSRHALRRCSRAQLAALLERRIASMAGFLLATPLQPHGALMLREMCDPTDAMPIIVDEFIRPQMVEMEAIVACLAPGASRTVVQRTVRSIVGQVLFYRFTMPAMLLLLRKRAYPRRFPHDVAAHVTAFSLGGLTRITRRRKRRAG